MKKHPRRTLVIADMHKSMPPGAKDAVQRAFEGVRGVPSGLSSELHDVINLLRDEGKDLDFIKGYVKERACATWEDPDDIMADGAIAVAERLLAAKKAKERAAKKAKKETKNA
ncbi:MAG: hypothetical protein WBE11_14225 [Candidatus Aminicenantaceae bacterium]